MAQSMVPHELSGGRDTEVERPGEQDDGAGATIAGVVRSAASLYFVTLLAVFAAALLYGVFDFETIGSIVLVLSVVIWGGALVVLIAGGLVSDARRDREAERASPGESLHDPWLDG